MSTTRKILSTLGLQTSKSGNISVRPWKDMFVPPWGTFTGNGPYKGSSEVKGRPGYYKKQPKIKRT